MEAVDLERLGVDVLMLRRRSWEKASAWVRWERRWRLALWVAAAVLVGAAIGELVRW